MTKTSWFIIILLIILIFSAYVSRNYNFPTQDHLKCKENLFTYIVFNKCTYRLNDYEDSSGPAYVPAVSGQSDLTILK